MLNDLKEMARHCWGEHMLKISQWIHPVRPRKKSWGGDFPDKEFLVIRGRGYGRGLYSYFQTTLSWCAYAEMHGLIPVVDLATERTVYSSRALQTANVWESYYDQPDSYALKDVAHAKNVILADSLGIPGDPCFRSVLGDDDNVETNQDLSFWRDLTARRFRPRNENLLRYRNDELEHALPDGVIGVLARGTDYLRLKPMNHPVQPSVEMLVDAVSRRLEMQEERWVFLATEDRQIANAMRQAFGNRLLVAKQDFVEYNGGLLRSSPSVRGNADRGFAYQRAVLDLSRCNALIAGRTSGTIGAVAHSKGFRFAKVFNLGRY